MNHNSLNINMDMGSLDIDHISNMRREFFFNKDYEPYAIDRDSALCELLKAKNIEYYSFNIKDLQVIVII